MDDTDERFEVIRGTGPSEAFVELWDRSLAPGGLAFEAIGSDNGTVTVTGHQLPVPMDVFNHFLAVAKSYLAPDLDDQSPGEMRA
jgi:hypothetical protein